MTFTKSRVLRKLNFNQICFTDPERMSNFSVSINNETNVIYRQHENPPPGVIDITKPFPLVVKSLKVKIPPGYDNFLSLCEVQLFGKMQEFLSRSNIVKQ